MFEWIEKVFGKHIHEWERLPGEWRMFDYPQTTYWNVKCRCGLFLRVYSNGFAIDEPENIRRGVSEQFWDSELRPNGCPRSPTGKPEDDGRQ